METMERDLLGLSRFFSGESFALKEEVRRTIGVKVKPKLRLVEKDEVTLTPEFFKKRRMEEQMRRSKFIQDQEEDLMLFANLIKRRD